ncbi:restriction endonuclease subunit S [Chryseobacterium sp. BIGb0232]|uniref:restriction endonuclease subunit S n=1 Tax=Chryseobacterium sp. BIGb0232 TaxID=2940598 RepID=UPI000F46B6F8|nr:restriction endonuclease subunit S [Chryseobacterium sp. BIGb0232]MCS4300615.1 type I restriction enzyme S subunit [Chryseobacterium sp. BIGb0232]ROS20499.1 restriction endonuclease S subunit [Chryseobacterium nakagawai]
MILDLETNCNFINGGSWNESDYRNKGIPVLKVSNFNSSGFSINDISYLDENLHLKYIKNKLELDDIIIATVGSHPSLVNSAAGRTIRVNSLVKDFYLNQNAIALKTKDPEVINQKYLYYLTETQKFRNFIQQRGKGAANQMRIPISGIKEFVFDFPTPETQRKIANILSGYDDLIENNQNRIKILEEMAQQTYEEWFVRMRFPGYETAVFDENGLPEDWVKVKLGEKIKLISGFAFKSKDFQDVQNNNIVVRMGNFEVGGGLKFIKNKYLVEGTKVKENHILAPFDLLMVLSDVTREGLLIGNVGFVPDDGKSYYLNQRVSKIVSDEDLKYYLFDVLNSVDFKNNCIAKANSVTVLNLKNEDITNYLVTLPNKNILSKWNDYSKSLRYSIFNLQSQNQFLRESRDILLPRLMTGMIDVKSLEVKSTNAKIIPLAQPKKEASKEFKEAVLIACLTDRFGSEKFPLGRKRYTKLSYLFHRYSDNKIQDYLRKAAGPYNPKTKYGGPEKIALTSKYIKDWKGEKGTTGFVVAEKIEDAKKYFSNYWQIADLDWLTTEFMFKSNDELELLATVDNSLVELSKKNLEFTTTNVLNIIKSEKEWEAKLERTIFSNANVERAIRFLTETLQYEK